MAGQGVSRSIATGDHIFVPSTIIANAGVLVTMTFNNTDIETHTFTSSAINIDRTLDTGQSTVFTFTMPSVQTPFVCTIHQNEGMVGTLIPS